MPVPCPAAHNQDEQKQLPNEVTLAQTNTEQPAESGTSASVTDDSDTTLFYALLQDSPTESSGPFLDTVRNLPLLKDLAIARDVPDHKFRPLLQLRHWWNQPQRFLPSVAFCAIVAWIFWFLIPEKLTRAQATIRAEFWKSALTGFCCVAVWLLFTRTIFLTHIGWPLGIVSTGCFQAALLIGFSVIVSMIGNAFAVLLHLKHWNFIATRPELLRVVELLLGSIVCGAIIMIPTPGLLPHATMRLLFVFAILGLGGVFKAFRQKASQLE